MTASCLLCGGAFADAPDACRPRSGAISLADEFDAAALLDLRLLLTVRLPSRCLGCWVALDSPHHFGCPVGACSIHYPTVRSECGCDEVYLSPSAQLRLAWRRLVAACHGQGEIHRVVPDADPEVS